MPQPSLESGLKATKLILPQSWLHTVHRNMSVYESTYTLTKLTCIS